LRKVQRELSGLRSKFSYAWRKFLHRTHIPTLSSIDQKIMDGLNRDGGYITSLAELSLPLNEQLVQAANEISDGLPKEPANADQFVFAAATGDILKNPVVFAWGLQERLLDIAENYLRVPVGYRGLFFQKDFANKQQVSTRLWHKDPEDHRLLKIVVYLNDVDAAGGPFEFIPKRFRGSLRFLRYKLFRSDAEVAERVDPSNWVSCTGKAGTVIFFSAGHVLHRGKVPVDSHRRAIFFNYHTRQPIKVYAGHWDAPFSPEELQVLSQDLPARQKACAFWWENGAESFQPKVR